MTSKVSETEATGRRQGRRRKRAAGRRPRLAVEFTDEEWSRVRDLAAEAGWSTGAWIARRALNPGNPTTRAGATSEAGAALLETMRVRRQLTAIGNNLNQIARAVNGVIAARRDHPHVAAHQRELVAVTRPLPAVAEALRAAVARRDQAEVDLVRTVRRRREPSGMPD